MPFIGARDDQHPCQSATIRFYVSGKPLSSTEEGMSRHQRWLVGKALVLSYAAAFHLGCDAYRSDLRVRGLRAKFRRSP